MKSLRIAAVLSTIIASTSSAQAKPETVTVKLPGRPTPRVDTNAITVFRGTTMKVDTTSIPIESLWVVGDTAWVTLRRDSVTTFQYRFQRGTDGSWFKRETVEKSVRQVP